MKDENAAPAQEMDVLKFYIWLMLVMTLALAGFLWYVWNDVEGLKKNVQQGDALRKDFAQMQVEIKGMLKVHSTNKEDIARDAPLSWFSVIWARRGIAANSIVPGAWKVPADYNARGKYYEERIDMTFAVKAPLTREQMAGFLHEIEKSSTRQRVIELEVRRTDKDNFDSDTWAGKAVVGYRHARVD